MLLAPRCPTLRACSRCGPPARRFLQIFRSNGASSLTLQQKLKLAGGVALGMHCLHDCSPQILRECSLAFTHALACQLHAVLLYWQPRGLPLPKI